MRKSVPHLFADMTARLEDLHGIAVEGQCSGLSPDIHMVLLLHLRTGAQALAATIEHTSARIVAGRE